jgi:hypothetical protein
VLDTADIVREAIYRQLGRLLAAGITSGWPTIHSETLSRCFQEANFWNFNRLLDPFRPGEM